MRGCIVNHRQSALYLLALVAWGGSDAAQADFITSATNNATVQPGGPRAGPNAKFFFDVEGSSNGPFASFGVVDFQTPSGATIAQASALSLTLVQDNAAFTHAGSLLFYLSTDTATNIEPATSPLKYQVGNIPTGLGTQLDPKFLLGSGSFTGVPGNSGNGTVDTFTFVLSAAAQSYLTTEVNANGRIRLIVAPNDAAVSATYAGFTDTTAPFAPPKLTILAVAAEPGSLALLSIGGVSVAGLTLRRRLRPSISG
jgi:hypothetical protein